MTGGASGIGRATAVRLAAEGMQVCVVDIEGAAAEAVAEPLGGVGLRCDVTDPDQVDATFASCMADLGGLDVAFLNAGVTIDWSGDIGSLDLTQYRRSIGVNLDGVVFGVRAAVRAMRSSGAGDRAILATSSLAGLMPWHPDPVYSLGKHAVVGMMRSIAPNLAAEGIAVHTICPGITETGVLGDRRPLVERIGVPVMEPEAIADAALDLTVMAWGNPSEKRLARYRDLGSTRVVIGGGRRDGDDASTTWAYLDQYAPLVSELR
ncbi:SDR family oxidoreductase [Mycobacterium sp. 852013-51886_SCH5428379]|uniref:SDR family oxidoreductase n=1 Tax=Mycobacterium sp. 852013-51886_SCH5428379 TaxID=1834111 RepID=UPI000A420650|nr:SDR family NAD(P)-dependent oxidoreductase [Mycobacterium sp. 852013-51886_SCH5428379]